MSFPVLCLCLLFPPAQASTPAQAPVSDKLGGIKAGIQTSDGAPVAGVLVRIQGRDGRIWATDTDDQGHFQAGGLPPGEYRIESRLAGFQGETCLIQIRAQAWLLGVPRGLSARPRAGAGTRALRFQGPATYEAVPGLIQPQKRPELGKIPMH